MNNTQKTIRCGVIKDLLPLYADGVLSDESRELVEAHLGECPECAEYLRKLRDPELSGAKKRAAEGRSALKKIRKTLRIRRLLTALITAACVAAAAGGIFYGVVVRETYIPYEESGLFVSADGEYLQTERNYHAMHGVYTDGGDAEFIYLTTTVYENMRKKQSVYNIELLTEAGRTTRQVGEDDGSSSYLPVETQVCTEIWYVPEDTAKQFMKGNRWTDFEGTDEEIAAKRQAEAEELKARSVLIWSAEG